MELNDFLDELLFRVKDWLTDVEKSEVNPAESPSDLRRQVRLPLPLEGEGLEGVLDGIDEFLTHSVKTHHPGFMNPLWGGFSASAFAGEVVAAVAQTAMYTFELAPLATLIEQAIIIRMSEMMGYADGNGILTTGGSNGNLLGMICARQAENPLTLKTGSDGTNIAVFVSAESHYSVLMAANVIGIGYDNVVKVACDEDGCMLPERLQEEIEISIREGKMPLCVIATSGTTVRGAFDPLREIAEIAHANGMWMHVDAAWGGSCLFSTTYADLMDGVELSDSVCWDAHKMMGIPLICSAFIIKRPEILRQVCSHGKVAHYLLHADAEQLDLGRQSLQCGRRNDALKLWLAWKEKGDAGWARMVERYLDLAIYLEEMVVDHPRLEMMSSRMWANVCFCYNPIPGSVPDDIDLDELNTEIRSRLISEGRFMISRSNIGDEVVLRPVISNPGVSEETLDELMDEIVRIGDELVF